MNRDGLQTVQFGLAGPGALPHTHVVSISIDDLVPIVPGPQPHCIAADPDQKLAVIGPTNGRHGCRGV
jgi:hypothetical protein